MPNQAAPLTRTPALERLLAGLRRRVVLSVWLHGLGTTVAGVGGWILWCFLADWALRVPGPVRTLHLVGLVGLTAFLLWRSLIRPLRRLPDRTGLALLLERARPDLHELLVSATQLQTAQSGDAQAGTAAEVDCDPQLVEAVLREADTRAAELRVSEALDERTPRSRFGLGAVVGGVLLALGLWNPLHTGIFVGRMLGGGPAWPQRTHLRLTIPIHAASAQVEEGPELVHVRVARGTDVPVLVHADGVVPSEVTLHFAGSRDLVLSPTGGAVFRTLLPCQEDLSFHVTGGDDLDGLPQVQIEVLQPPDVEGVAFALRPPPYTGLPEAVVFDRDVEVIAGTAVSVHLLPTPREASGTARLLPEDREVDLRSAPFPHVDDDVLAQEPGLAFDLVPDSSVGVRFHLSDATGLTNPDPGVFRIHVLEDRAPDVRVLAPGRTEYETVIGGAIPVRARAEDDFGLVSLQWNVEPQDGVAEAGAAAASPARISGTFDAVPLGSAPPGEAPRGLFGATRLDVADLAPPGTELQVDQRFLLTVEATDTRAPEPGQGRSMPVRIRLISADELLRRMQDRLARARLDASRLAELQREKRGRVEELLDSLDGAGSLEAGDALALHGAGVGQRRVRADAESLAQDLAQVAEDVLYARIDDKAGGLLESLHAAASLSETAGFDPAPWAELARAHAAGELGSPGFSGNLVDLVGLALAISEEDAAAASAALDRAQDADDLELALGALTEAVELQTACLTRIESLLEALAEWDNFQNVLALTRDILNRQKALRDRTKRVASEK